MCISLQMAAPAGTRGRSSRLLSHSHNNIIGSIVSQLDALYQQLHSIGCSAMKTLYKVFVLGAPAIGKTTILEEAIYGNRHRLTAQYEATTEDIYCALIDTDKKTRERVYFYDFAGITKLDLDALKMYLSFCDAFILVYAVHDRNSFLKMEEIKKNIDRFKEKKDIPILVFAHKMDNTSEYAIGRNEAQSWAEREKVKLFEVSATDRSTIIDKFIYLTSVMSFVPHKSSFSQLRKSKTSNIPLEL